MALTTGYSYYNLQRADRTRDEYATYTPHFDLIPVGIAPLEKQCRVFLNDTEHHFLDLNEIPRRTSNYWTHTPESTATGGIACWGLRITMQSASVCALQQFAMWDGDGNLITVDETWSTQEEAADDDVFDATAFDLDPETGNNYSTGDTITLRFPRQLVISMIGWTSRNHPTSSFYIEDMEFEVNTGTPFEPNWVSMGSNLTQDVGNATSHTAGQSLNQADYPVPSDPIVPATDLLTLSVTAANQGGTLHPVITLSDPPSDANDIITIIRETRQDRPWVVPTNIAYGRPDQFMVYFDHVRYIAQDLCEIETIAGFFSLPVAEFVFNDFTFANQSVYHNGGGTTLSYSTVELLSTIPGAQLDDRHQLVVEKGDQTDGSSTVWTPMTYAASPLDDDQYSVDSSANTITIGGAGTTNDVRIRRVTRTDDWWYDPRGTPPGWNSLGVNTMQKQARMMLEEACFLPVFYSDHPLSTSIFPRAWNWFTFTETQDIWNIPGSPWGGDGVVVVYDNDLELIEFTDWYLEFPQIIFDIPPTGPVDIGIGGGSGWGGGMGDDEDTGQPGGNGEQGGPPVDWPGLELPPTFGIDIDISAVSKDDMIAGNWEGATSIDFSQGNAIDSEFNDHMLRLQLTVTAADTIPDGPGFWPVGATSVLYFHRVCPGSPIARSIANADDPDGNGTWDTTSEASESLGCLQPLGAVGAMGLAAAFFSTDPPINSGSVPQLLMLRGLYNIDSVAAGDIENVPFFTSWQNLVELSQNAEDAGVVGESGFTWDQFQDYVDPFTDFTDFDIPDPP